MSLPAGTTGVAIAAPATTSARAPRLGRHVPALDGVRGIAILAVLLLHYEGREIVPLPVVGRPLAALFGLGWSGVDLFFVLSGFLITGILLDTRSAPRYFRTFYARRTLRIFPLYYVSLVVLLVLLPSVAPDALGAASIPPLTQFCSWAYVTNHLVAVRGWSALAPGTQHFWTLAIEEQFYLVWPLVVLKLGPRALIRVCLAAAVASLVLRVLLVATGASPVFVLSFTLTRLEPLVIGGALAVLVRTSPLVLAPPLRRLALAAAAVALLGAAVALDGRVSAEGRFMSTIGITAVALGSASLVATATLGRSRGWSTIRLLEIPGLRLLGQYSYALYVWHYPLLLIIRKQGITMTSLGARIGSPLAGHVAFLLLNLAVSLAVAAASWHLLEMRFLALKDRFAYQPREVDAAAA